MPKDLSPAESETLEQWMAALREALRIPSADFPTHEVLGLTGRVARQVARPAVPPTAYLLGFHAGRAVAAGEDEAGALRRALDAVAALVPADRDATEPDDTEEN